MSAPHPALLRILVPGPASAVEDEDALLASAYEHRMVAALLNAHERGAIHLSRTAATTLSIWDLAERREHLRLWATYAEVLRRLAPLGADVAIIKGLATETRWYDQPGERVTGDLDLLLDPAFVDDGAAVAAAIDPDRGMTDAIDWLVRRRLLQHVDLRVGNVQVDLHFDPLKIGIPTLQTAEVWRTTQLLDTNHGRIRVLRPEIELVMLLLHLNKDSFAYLGPYLDIGRIIRRGDLAWDYIERFVAGEGLTVPVFKSLAAVTDVLGIRVEAIRPAGLRALTWDLLWGADNRLRGQERRATANRPQKLLAMHATGRTRHVIREMHRRLLPPRQLVDVAAYQQEPATYLHQIRNALIGARRTHPHAARGQQNF